MGQLYRVTLSGEGQGESMSERAGEGRREVAGIERWGVMVGNDDARHVPRVP
jgi:hypothetical protein